VFVGSVVDTVTTFPVLPMENIGTGVELFGVETAVREEMLALCANPAGAKTIPKRQAMK
jgi:hypothetical protein